MITWHGFFCFFLEVSGQRQRTNAIYSADDQLSMKLQKQIIVYNEWLVSEKCRVSWGGCDGIAAKRPAVQTALAVYSETVIKWMWYAREGFSADVDIPRDSYWGEIELCLCCQSSNRGWVGKARRCTFLSRCDVLIHWVKKLFKHLNGKLLKVCTCIDFRPCFCWMSDSQITFAT